MGEVKALARALDERARLGRALVGMTDVLRGMGDHEGAMAAGRLARSRLRAATAPGRREPPCT